MAEATTGQQARRERQLLISIAGEIDPSFEKTLRRVERATSVVADNIKDANEKQLKITDYVKRAAKELDTSGEIFEKYNDIVGETGDVWNALASQILYGKKAIDDTSRAKDRQIQNLGRWGTVLNRIKSIWSGFLTTLKEAPQILIAIGAALIALGTIKIGKAVFEGIIEALKTIASLAKDAFDALADVIGVIAEEAVEVNVAFQNISTTLRAMLGSEQAAAAYMEEIRQAAIATGHTFAELAQHAQLLVPFTGGDPQRFREILTMALKLQAYRSDVPLRSALRAVTQMLSGTQQAFVRIFNIPTDWVKEVEEAGLTGAEAIEALLEKMRLGDDILEAHATSWLGLNNIIKDFAQNTLLSITRPAFEVVNGLLQRLVNWLEDNASQINTLATLIGRDLGQQVAMLSDAMFGPEGFSEEKIFDIAEWGIRLITSLVHGLLEGVNTVLIPALIFIGETIAQFLRGASPPRSGVLSTIDRWFGPILRAYLSGFTSDDFTVLNDVGNIIKAALGTALAGEEISREEYNNRLMQGRALLVNMVNELRRFGQVSASTWSSLQNIVGMDIQLVQTYLDLMGKVRRAMDIVRAAQDRLRIAQEAYARALKRVQDIQDEITIFEIETADIPERYTRGRRRELDLRLLRAQQEARLHQEAVTAAREQVRVAQEQLKAAREQLSVFKQMLTQLSQLAQAAAKAGAESEDVFAWTGDVDIVDKALGALEGRFIELWATWREAFAPVKEDLQFLMDFFKGLVGQPLKEDYKPWDPRGWGPDTSEGYEQGVRLHGIFQEIRNNAYKVGEAFQGVLNSLASIAKWYDRQPEWFKSVLRTGALAIGLNFLMGGVAGDIASGIKNILLGTGLIYFAKNPGALGTALGKLAGMKAAAAAATPFIIPIGIILGVSALASGPLAESIYNFFEGVQTKLSEAFPWFKSMFTEAGEIGAVPLWSRPGLEPYQPGTEINRAAFDTTGKEATKSFMTGVGKFLEEGADSFVELLNKYISTPLQETFQDASDEIYGDSIIPDMIDGIIDLFKRMSRDILWLINYLVRDMRIYLEAMYSYWAFYLGYIKGEVRDLIYEFQELLSLMQQVSQEQAESTHWSSNIPGYQHGGLVPRLQRALVHPGELILNIAQQRNVAMALASPGSGFGAGALNLNLYQSGWTFNGTPDVNEVKRMVRDGTYEAFVEVTRKARHG